MKKIKKSKAMSDVKIEFVSLVKRAANKRKFLIAKSDATSGSAERITRAEIQEMIDASIRKAAGEDHYMHGFY